MQAIIHIKNKRTFTLPLGYNYLLSSAIYSLLSLEPELSAYIHDKGFEAGTGRHKLFTFSQLKGDYHIQGKELVVTGDLNFEVRSISDRLMNVLKDSAFQRGTIRLGNNVLEIRMIEVYDRHLFEPQVTVRTLSPIAAAVSFDGRTIYYSPADEQFESVLANNLANKFYAVYEQPSPSSFDVKLLNKPQKIVTRVKGIWVTAYHARLLLTAHPQAMDLLYNTGLGTKNSQGFGMFEPI